MADNVKISDLVALTAAQDSTIVPVVDGGTTKKMDLSTLQTHLTASFVTPSQLSTQISNVNSTIDALDTDDIAEGTNEYYTNAKVDARIADIVEITSSAMVNALEIQNLTNAVKPILNANDVISGSLTTSSIENFPTEVSRSAAAAGFGVGGGGGGTDLSGTGVVSASAQISAFNTFVENSITSSMTVLSASYALTASYAENAGGGGGGGTDYISNITLSDSTLTFTGVGNGFDGTINLAIGGGDNGNLLTTDDAGNFLGLATYETDSSSFASRIDSAGGGTADWNTLANKPSGIVSASQQITAINIDLTGLTIDDIGNGSVNRYYADSLVKSYIDSIDVVSGSVVADMDFSGTNIVSSSTQIELLGFVSNQTYGQGTSSLQAQIDLLDSGISVNDENIFLAEQFFTQGMRVTGSILLTGVGASFSGSGALLSNIPAAAIVGSVPVAATSLSDGGNSITANSVTGITINAETGSVRVTAGNLVISSGSVFSGSGAGLYDIPGSAIIGGVGGGTSIATGSVTASVDPNLGLIVNSDISASGDITARSISVGASGTPTIYSSNNLNLSASNAVVITDSPLRLTPFTNAETASFTFSEGDLVYSSDSDDFYGYRVIDGTGSLVSLTAGGSGEVTWVSILGKPNGLISSSAGFVSSSAQILPNGGTGDVLFENSVGLVTSSTEFRYTEGTRTLTSPTMSVGVLSYNTLSGPAAATGSFNLVDADRVLINNDYELPTSDGTLNQIILTDGNGNASFGNASTAINGQDVSLGNTTLATASISQNLSVTGDITLLGEFNQQTISDTVVEFNGSSISINSSDVLILSSSNGDSGVVIDDVLVLTPKHPKPTSPATGSIIVSASASGPLRPWFYDGNGWFQMFA